MAGLEQVQRVTSRLDARWLVICLGAELLGYVGYVLALRNIARVDGGPRLSFALAARTVVSGFGVYAAAHAAGGFAVDYWALRRAGLKRDQAIARVAGLGVLEYAVLAPVALVCALILLADSNEHVQESMTLPWLAVIPGSLVAVWISSPKRRWYETGFEKSGRFHESLAHAVSGLITLRLLSGGPSSICPAYSGSCSTGSATSPACGLRSGRSRFTSPGPRSSSPTPRATWRAAARCRRAAPGIIEVLMTFALVWVGLPLAPALAGVLVYRLFNFWLPIVPALALLPSITRLRHANEQAKPA